MNRKLALLVHAAHNTAGHAKAHTARARKAEQAARVALVVALASELLGEDLAENLDTHLTARLGHFPELPEVREGRLRDFVESLSPGPDVPHK